MKKRILTMWSLALILSGCTSLSHQMINIHEQDSQFEKTLPSANANYGKEPQHYEKQIKLYMNNVLKDPDSAKYSGLTKPFKSHVIYKKSIYQPATHSDVHYGYSVCFSLNAKNSYGAYVGKTQYVAFFYNDKVLEIKQANSLSGKVRGIYSAYIGSSFIDCPVK